jgi:NAD(P)-dependent dehydrogenase (short-subunit alcohol dehydrogenase family)
MGVFTGKTAVVTEASSGIGRAVALRLGEAGAHVFAAGRRAGALAGTVDAVAGAGGAATAVAAELRDPGAVQGLVDRAMTDTGRLDVMVNNAGILLSGRFEDIAVEAHHTEIDINTKGVVNGLHAAFPYLRATPGAVVVNLASASAIYGQAELANYSATKFFIRAITEALDVEWQRYGIRVVDMWPLYVATAMTKGVKTGTTDSLGIRLSAQDVADDIVKAVDPSWPRRLLHQVHFPVGRQAKTSAMTARFLPGWLLRAANKRLAHG